MDAHEPHVRRVETEPGVRLSVTEAGTPGDRPTVVLLHGFPDLSYTWRHQIPALAAAGHHVLAPDGRGHGRSSRPADVHDYDIDHLYRDVTALLDDVGAERGVVVGHDTGALLAWEFALLAPERVAGVVGIGTPFVPRGTAPPTAMLRQFAGDQWVLMLWLQEPGIAEEDLEADVRKTLWRVFGGLRVEAIVGSQRHGEPRNWVDRLDDPDTLPGWLTTEDFDHYVSEFRRTGFTGGLNTYRNWDRDWELTPQLAGAHLSVPSLYLSGAEDPLLIGWPPVLMEGWLDDHRGSVFVPGAGRWVHQQRPDVVNEALLEFLADVLPVGRASEPDPAPPPPVRAR
jgi:pimeloyl-ACP methyl ester carboxylesterase